MGPWSRSFVAAVAGNAARPELEVEALRIDPGEIWPSSKAARSQSPRM